jgi:predicted phage terminase large subunit-like protein
MLYQQRAGNEHFRIRAEYFASFSPGARPWSQAGVVLSIDPGQKTGAAHAFSVVQVWQPLGNCHLLLDQWRAHATYSELRAMTRHLIKRYRPSVVLVEDTNLGPALCSEIRHQAGMAVHAIFPQEEKSERLRRHRQLIRAGRVALPREAQWRCDFIHELTHFPYAGTDDQVDAMTQYLDWIAQHPEPPKREPPALGILRNSRGFIQAVPALTPDLQCRGGILVRASRRW